MSRITAVHVDHFCSLSCRSLPSFLLYRVGGIHQHRAHAFGPWSAQSVGREKEKTVAKVNIKVFSHPPDYICFTTAVELIELQSLGHMSACAGRSSCHSKHLHWKNANIVLLACSSSLLPWLHPQLVCWSLEGALQRAVCSCQRDPVPRQFSFSRKQALRIPYASSTFYLA